MISIEKVDDVVSPESVTWSLGLLFKLSELTPKQRSAIEMIVMAETVQVPITRLLKTSYSCRWCGQVLGRTGEPATLRRQRLNLHEANCRTESRRFHWTFACASSTFYNKWMKDHQFEAALNQARYEMTQNRLTTAARLLQLGTTEAARELLRQIAEGERDLDKRAAAVAVLDRADVLTASKSKSDEDLRDWLSELRNNEVADV